MNKQARLQIQHGYEGDRVDSRWIVKLAKSYIREYGPKQWNIRKCFMNPPILILLIVINCSVNKLS